MSSILQARGRAENIHSAYVNAKSEFAILGNQDESFDYSKIGIPPSPSRKPIDGTAGRTDKDIIPFEWLHVPYTAELAKGIGKMVGELGRAQASSQQSLALMEKMLVEEQRRVDGNPDEATEEKRRRDAGVWWRDQKAIRVKAWYWARDKALKKR
jgi:hypothetical protein